MFSDEAAVNSAPRQGLGPTKNENQDVAQRRKKDQYSWDEKFVWNFYLIQELLKIIKNKKWILPVVNGYISMISKFL